MKTFVKVVKEPSLIKDGFKKSKYKYENVFKDRNLGYVSETSFDGYKIAPSMLLSKEINYK